MKEKPEILGFRNSMTYVQTIHVKETLKSGPKLARLPKEVLSLGTFDLDEELKKFLAGEDNNLRTVCATRGLMIEKSAVKLLILDRSRRVVRMKNLVDGLTDLAKLFMSGKWEHRFLSALKARSMTYRLNASSLLISNEFGMTVLAVKK